MDNTNLEEPLLPREPETDAPTPPTPTHNNAGQQQQPTASRASAAPVVSRNIPVMLWFQFIRCGAEAIWLSSVLTAYVYLIRPNNPEMIGYLSAVEGITQFVAACLAGILADKYRRDLLLKITSIIGITACILIVLSPLTGIFGFLVVALMLNGAFDGIGLTASLALFADSIQEGDRSYYFTQRTLCTTIGQFLGPICGLVMFYCMGDQWTLQACGRVMIAAQILLVPGIGLLWLFRDENATETNGNDGTTNNNEDDEETATRPLLQEESDEPINQLAATVGSGGNTDDDTECDQPVLFFGITKARLIAISAAGSDILCAFASGISFRYFSLFLLHNLQFGPVLVQILDALSCLMGGGLMVCAQRVSLYFGRCYTSVAFKMVGIGCLLAMVVSYKHVYEQDNTSDNDSGDEGSRHNHYHDIMICAFYLLQNAFLDSTGALTQGLIMDNVPSGERGRWSALESINIFGWCGSAAIGGIIVQKSHGDILPVFYVTAVLQVVGCLPLVALFGIDTKEKQRQQGGGGEEEEEVALVEEQLQTS